MEHEFERQLRALAIERRPEACLGCGFEHGCSVHGCAVIHAAVNRLAAYEETQPAASNNEQNDNTAAQIRAAAAARARYEAIKDEQAEERLTGIAQGTEMAPKNSQNPLLNWSPKSFPGLTIQ